MMQVLKKLQINLPFLYFAGIWMLIAVPTLVSGGVQGLIPMLISTGFIGLMFFQRKHLNLLIGILMFFWSILILFAYLSDASKLDSADLQASRFLIFGGLICVLNFLMSYLIVKKSINNRSFTTDTLNATAI
jgi:hypothetical protein